MITVLYDNQSRDPALRSEWGFSCLIEGLPRTILFDTGGDADVFLGNVAALGKDIAEVDALVISHDHWDHTGGMDAVLGRAKGLDLFVPAGFSEEMVRQARAAGADVIESDKSVEVAPGAFTTDVLEGALREQALCIETPEGLAVITGCAHPGVVELAGAAGRAGNRPVHTVFGGFHMKGFEREEIDDVIARLRKLGVRRAGPSHCSGEQTQEAMRETFGDDYIELGVGATVAIPPA